MMPPFKSSITLRCTLPIGRAWWKETAENTQVLPVSGSDIFLLHGAVMSLLWLRIPLVQYDGDSKDATTTKSLPEVGDIVVAWKAVSFRVFSMEGGTSIPQAADPPDPGSELQSSGSPLHPSQFSPLPQSPDAYKAQFSSPPCPTSPWVFKKTNSPSLDLGPLDVNMISPVAAALETPPKSHKQLQILPSLKSKELDTISAQYTTLSAKSKGISPAATNPTNTVTNPNAITVHRRPRSEVIAEDTHQGHTPSLDVPKQGVPPQSKSQTSGFTGPAKEILNPTMATPSKSRRKAKSKLNPAAVLDPSALSKTAPGSVSTSFQAAPTDSPANSAPAGPLQMVMLNQDSQAAIIPYASGVGPSEGKPFINSASKKRKGSHLSKRSSPDPIGGDSIPSLFTELSLVNPFAILETRNLGRHNASTFSFNSKEPDGDMGISIPDSDSFILKKFLKKLHKHNYSQIQKRVGELGLLAIYYFINVLGPPLTLSAPSLQIRDFWSMKESQSYTWLFKQILRQREIVINWLRVIPVDGNSINFWTSPWTPYGQLIRHVGPNGPRQSGFPLLSSLASLWNGESWTLAPARSPEMEQVQIYLSIITLLEDPDYPEWIQNNASSANTNKFISAQIYDSIRESRPQVPWHRIVWLKKGIPKFKTLTWMFVQDRCPTRNRLLSWGLQTDPLCLLCNLHPECRNHIYFQCSFSMGVWRNLSSKLGLIVSSDEWDDILQALIGLTGNKHLRYLTILAWQSAIHEIWRERNNKLHRSSFKSIDVIISTISSIIKNCISAMRQTQPLESSACMKLWFSLP
ncbi:hypothetical protein HID58_037772 [Brassica napus]|uniref:Reverse transcriptase zinc-binding domain-containing protein n=1 Tax=Brassica napus TaxID=3708 RepID=A0ABQ8BMA5_BRANA|nr:hypothetical protein HID58_037772 [Brassica napus]